MFRYRLRYGTALGPEKWPFYGGTFESTTGETTVLFLSQATINFCRNRSIKVGMDATFKVVPRIGGAYQLFGIHLLEEGSVSTLKLNSNKVYCTITAQNRQTHFLWVIFFYTILFIVNVWYLHVRLIIYIYIHY